MFLRKSSLRQLWAIPNSRPCHVAFSTLRSRQTSWGDDFADNLQYLKEREAVQLYKLSQRVQSAKRYLDNHIHETPSIEQLLKAAGPQDYICTDKVDNARRAFNLKVKLFNHLDDMLLHHKDLQEEPLAELDADRTPGAGVQSQKELEKELIVAKATLESMLKQLETKVEELEVNVDASPHKESDDVGSDSVMLARSDSMDVLEFMMDDPDMDALGTTTAAGFPEEKSEVNLNNVWDKEDLLLQQQLEKDLGQ